MLAQRSRSALRTEGQNLSISCSDPAGVICTGRADLTGPNPTVRGKLGTKRHVLTDGRGVVLGVTLTGANVHDKGMVGETRAANWLGDEGDTLYGACTHGLR